MPETDGPVVVLTHYFAPAVKAGGPVQSLAALTASELGHRVRVLAGDRDLGDTEPMPGVARRTWTPSGAGQVMHFDAGDVRTPWRALRTLRGLSPSHVYLNSLFGVTTGLLPLGLAKLRLLGPGRLVLAPRGQLDPGALALSATRKRLVLRLLRALRLLDGVRWHATSDLEARHIRNVVGNGAEVCVVPPLPPSLGRSEDGGRVRPAVPLRLLFLSRISPKKGLDTLLRALATVPEPVGLDVYGPSDDASYAAVCRALAAQLPGRHRVTFHGTAAHARVGQLMQAADAFVLPTLGENFGHAIFEALTAGCPVVLTPTTPWTEAVRGGAGWLVEPGDVAGLAHVISLAVATSEADFSAMSSAATGAAAAYRRRAEGAQGWAQLFA